ncbi:hypothetical protein M409DRAFT_68247 [Zasmidium cellare ATCC 36951]|uniref:FAD-binding domain-containing protein n=1 Tax=Zasmidium cellare ATCC 36951 TaxID=1080233 RepID=A0A6A6CDP2_ZASCE|nr:uncharacterized protein M409DRAFT_68247 [Zasmidium cellare ATCC 36951]KAF2164032.1 hypothetical protein M409DRAFT_68247 [Zasmidium cellare ATCC 36951]
MTGTTPTPTPSTLPTRSPPTNTTILISGAGIGGLFTALECWRLGFTVRILERAAFSSAQGDSVTIGPSALSSLRNWPWLHGRNLEITETPLLYYCNHRGERLSGPIDMDAVVASGRVYMHARPRLHEMLLTQLRACGVEVEYGRKVVGYYEDEGRGKGGVVVQGGERVEGDVVVAADGVHTRSWELVQGEEVGARSSGHGILRAAFGVDVAMADEAVRERWPLEEGGRAVVELWVGPDVYCTFLRSKDRFTWTLTHPDHGTAEESWSHKVDVEEALKFTAKIPDFPDYANRLIKLTPPDKLIDWKLMWRDPNSQWTSPGGRVIQLGDAAHSFLPSSGNGGTQAIEDAISLATCLSLAHTTHQPLPLALRIHNLLRFERVSCLQAFGVLNRDARNTKNNDPKDKKHEVRLGKWIVEHDPEVYARERWDEAVRCVGEGREKEWRNGNVPKGMVYVPWTIDGLMEARGRGERTVLDGDWS